jgi:hypothetical protein
MGPTGSPEMLVLNHLMPRNNPEDERIWLTCGSSGSNAGLMDASAAKC